jgi:signal transduction histidine kinase
MAEAEIICTPDPTGAELQWSERVPQAIGLFVVSVAVVIAWQRREFVHPNFELAMLGLTIFPWVLDLLGRPHRLLREQRLRYPLNIAWTVIVFGCVYWLSVHGAPYADDFAPFFGVILIGEMASTVGPRFGALVWAVGIAGLVVLTNVNHFTGLVVWGFAFTIGWMGGTAFRTQVQMTTELTNAQAKLAERAAEDERHRLARDIHDLIAHSLAVTMLQLSGARLALQAGDTEEAVAALQDAETAGRSAMAEIHRTVGLLGVSEGDPTAPPTPSALDLPALIDSFRRAGLMVHFELAGELSAVPLAPGLAGYRVVQESLSNAVKHAPGAEVHLRVAVTADALEIRVVNPVVGHAPRHASGGHGLRGMAERAHLLGGSAVAGNGDGTWKVAASIPWELTPA